MSSHDWDPLSEEHVPSDAGRRSRIVTAAARLFHEKGYSGTTVRDLAGTVGVASGSIFHHFGSKEEILLAVVRAGLAHATDAIAVVNSDVTDPIDRVTGMVHAHLSAILDGTPTTMSVLFHEHSALSEEARQTLVEMRDGYEQLWDEALSGIGGEMTDERHRRLVRLLLFGAMNWCAQWYHTGGDLTATDIADQLSRLYFGRQENSE